MFRYVFFVLLPMICFSASLDQFVTGLDRERKSEFESVFRNLLASSEAGYVIYGNKPICMLNISDSLPLRLTHSNSLSLNQLFDLLKECQLQTREDLIVKRGTATKEICPGRNLTEVLFINRRQFLKVVDENIVLFQYILGPEITAEKLLEKLLDVDKTLSSVLHDNHALIGITLGYGTQNSLFYHWQATPVEQEQDLTLLTRMKKSQPGFSQNKELENLQKKMHSIKSVESSDAYPALPNFNYIECEETKNILAEFRKTRQQIRTALFGDLLKSVLSRLSDDFPDLKQLPQRRSKLSNEIAVTQALAQHFVQSLQNLQITKNSFLEGFLSKEFIPSMNLNQVYKSSIELSDAYNAYMTCVGQKKMETTLKDLENQDGVTCFVPGKLYKKIIQKGEGIQVTDPMIVSFTYHLEDCEGTALSGCYRQKSLAEFIPGLSIGLSGMKVGEISDLWVAPEYAGEHSTLRFGFKVRIELSDAHIYREPSGFVNFCGQQSGPSFDDRSPHPNDDASSRTPGALLMQYGSPHDHRNLDHSEDHQNSQNLTVRGIDKNLVERDLCSRSVPNFSQYSEEELKNRYLELEKKSDFYLGHEIGLELSHGIDLGKVAEAIQSVSESPSVQIDNKALHLFYQHLFTKKREEQQRKALEHFSTLQPSVKCINKDRLYVDLLKKGNGPKVLKGGKITIRRIMKQSVEATGTEKVVSLDLATAIRGFEEGFAGHAVGSKLRLHIHPDWGYAGCLSQFGDSLLIVDAEILSID